MSRGGKKAVVIACLAYVTYLLIVVTLPLINRNEYLYLQGNLKGD